MRGSLSTKGRRSAPVLAALHLFSAHPKISKRCPLVFSTGRTNRDPLRTHEGLQINNFGGLHLFLDSVQLRHTRHESRVFPALVLPSPFSNLIKIRKSNPRKNTDDRDDDHQLYQSKTPCFHSPHLKYSLSLSIRLANHLRKKSFPVNVGWNLRGEVPVDFPSKVSYNF